MRGITKSVRDFFRRELGIGAIDHALMFAGSELAKFTEEVRVAGSAGEKQHAQAMVETAAGLARLHVALEALGRRDDARIVELFEALGGLRETQLAANARHDARIAELFETLGVLREMQLAANARLELRSDELLGALGALSVARDSADTDQNVRIGEIMNALTSLCAERQSVEAQHIAGRDDAFADLNAERIAALLASRAQLREMTGAWRDALGARQDRHSEDESPLTRFDTILSRIAGGEDVPSSELLPYLCLEERERRGVVNKRLAEAYWKSGREEHLQHAKIFIQRAWVLSGFLLELLPLYNQIHSALGDIAGIKAAYKRIGMGLAVRGDVSAAINYFDLWQYAYANFMSVDSYEYDFDILECVDRLARPHKFSPRPSVGRRQGEKVRLAYLVRGVEELGSVLIRVNLLFARFHDRSRFEPMFFVPQSERVLASPEAEEHSRQFESHGCRLIMAPDADSAKDRLIGIASLINEADADILITTAALASFEHYFVTCLHPAPVQLGLALGPPPQFAPPMLDLCIAGSRHLLMDCPVDCAFLDLEWSLPDRGKLVPYLRHELGIPDNAVLMMTAGRHVKFQEPEFWAAVIGLLEQHPQLYYLALGVSEAQVPFVSSMISREVKPRLRLLSWRSTDEYLRILCLADVLIDTFPSGGAAVLFDAMALGIPVVTFQNNYMRLYDQTDWSPAEEFVNTPETICTRGDFAQMRRVVSRLVSDQDYRRDIGQRVQTHIRQTRGDPARTVRDFEEIYLRVLNRKSAGTYIIPT